MSDATTHSTTLERPPARAPRLITAQRRRAVRRWWRRKPVNKLMVWLHRWPALILGLLLVVETTSGAILLYHQEYFRATNGSFYAHTATTHPLTEAQAIDLVAEAAPGFTPTWVAHDHGIIAVGDSTYATLYSVDPGSGAVHGPLNPNSGMMGFLVNLHDCGLSCSGYPGSVSWLAHPVWDGGPTFLTGITWSALILGSLGVLMILLFVTGVKIWWAPLCKLGKRFYEVRRGKGRFARDYDLHNVIAAWAMPFILMWGITGAAFEFPGVENAWLAVTGGDKPDPNAYLFSTDNPEGTDPMPLARAESIALARVPGQVRYVELASKDTPYYGINIKTDWGASEYRAFYSGDVYVYVDAYDPRHIKTTPAENESTANQFYDKILEPTHFGWNVNGWWRLIWLTFGLAPLALMITGISTWLFRRGVTKRRSRAGAARATASSPVDDLDAAPVGGS